MTQNLINSKQPFIQYVKTQLTSAVTVNSAIPKDNTKPQITEGVEVMTCTITPTKATNLLLIKVNLNFVTSNATDIVMALFQDDGADAIGAIECQYLYGANWASQNEYFFSMVAGTTSSTTFKIRCGRNIPVTVTVNKAQFGGVETNYMEITEVKV